MEMFYQVLERKKKKNRVSGIIRIYEVTKIKRDELWWIILIIASLESKDDDISFGN